MDKFFNWIKEHKVKAVLIVVGIIAVIVFGIPIAINFLFLDNGGIPVKWEAKDYLIFYGSFLAFIGTAFLGIIAWKQNSRLHNEMKNVERRKLFSETRPYLYIHISPTGNSKGWDKLRIGDIDNNPYTMIEFKLDNQGKDIATCLNFILAIGNNEYNVEYKNTDLPDAIKFLPASRKLDINNLNKFIISVDNTEIDFKQVKEDETLCVLIVKFNDYYLNRYQQNFEFIVTDISTNKKIEVFNCSNKTNVKCKVEQSRISRVFGSSRDKIVADIRKVSFPKVTEESKEMEEII